MGYFPNGTPIGIFMSRFCEKCHHYADENCAVMAAHLETDYCNSSGGTSEAGAVLDIIIPEDLSTCLMFVEEIKP
jgi:hypothetical protein